MRTNNKIPFADYLESLQIASTDNCLLASSLFLLSHHAKTPLDLPLLVEVSTNIHKLIEITLNFDTAKAKQEVNHPKHYNTGKIEVITYLDSLNLTVDFCLGNAIKYLSRYKFKGDLIGDLEKAKWYVDYLISYYERQDK